MKALSAALGHTAPTLWSAVRPPRDRFNRVAVERQHSAALLAWDAGPDCPRQGDARGIVTRMGRNAASPFLGSTRFGEALAK
jgi:hypothetical protein